MSLDSDWMERREEAKEQGEEGGGSGDGEWAKGEGRPGRESPVMVRVDGLVQGCA